MGHGLEDRDLLWITNKNKILKKKKCVSGLDFSQTAVPCRALATLIANYARITAGVGLGLEVYD